MNAKNTCVYMFSILFAIVDLYSQSEILAQIVKMSQFGSRGALLSIDQLPTADVCVVYHQKIGLFRFDVDALLAELLLESSPLSGMDHVVGSSYRRDSLVLLLGKPPQFLGIIHSQGTTLDIRDAYIDDVHALRCEGCPLERHLYNHDVSWDLGETWIPLSPDSLVIESQFKPGDSVLSYWGRDGYLYVLLPGEDNQAVVTGISRRVWSMLDIGNGRDNVAWDSFQSLWAIQRLQGGRRNLLQADVGDTTHTTYDSLIVDGVYDRISPIALRKLWADSMLYVGQGGVGAVLRNEKLTTFPFPFVPQDVLVFRQTIYLLRYDQDSVRIALATRGTFPSFNVWSLHRDFERRKFTYTDLITAPLGSLGFVSHRGESFSFLCRPGEHYPLLLGAIYGDELEATKRSFINVWADGTSLPIAVDDLGRVCRIEGRREVKVTYPALHFDNLVLPNDFNGHVERTLPWFGVRTPQPWQVGGTDTLAHSGSVVRRLLRRGDVQDTVWRGFTTAFARIDASTWSVANHDALWVRTGADTMRHELAPLRTATGLLPGYPSSITPLGGTGRLLLSFYGTMRSDSDFVPQPYRHGGLAVVDGRQEVRSVPLPAECGSYVYPVHRLSDGTLVALTAAMREDTADGERRTPQLTNVRYVRSTDGGASWTSSAPLFYSGEWLPCTGKVIDLGGGYVLGVMPGSVVVSTDGGRTWDFDERVPASMRAIDIHLAGNNLLVAAHDGLYRINGVTSVDGDAPLLPPRREPLAMSRQSFRAHVSTLDAAAVYDMGGRVLCTSQDCESIDRMPLPLGSVVMVVSTSERRMYYVE